MSEIKQVLREIELLKSEDRARTDLVFQAMALAQQRGYAVGVRFDFERGLPEVYIELPEVGQVGWHVFPHRWDGSDSEERHRRVKAFAERHGPAGMLGSL